MSHRIISNSFIPAKSNLVGLLYLFVCIVILILGIIYGKERMLLYDGSMSIFTMAETIRIPVCDNRYTAGVNMILPWLLSRYSAPMYMIVYAYAINSLIIPLTVFVLLGYRSTTNKYQLAFLLSMLLFGTSSFYIGIFDLWNGFFLTLLLYRLLDDQTLKFKSFRKNTSGILLVILILFSHPINIVSIVFLIAWQFIKGNTSKSEWASYVFIIGVIILVKGTFLLSGYEKSVLTNSSEIKGIIRSLTLSGVTKSLLSHNIPVTILLAATLVFYLKKGNITTPVLITLNLTFSIVLVTYLFPGYGLISYTSGYLKTMNILLAATASEAISTTRLRTQLSLILACCLLILTGLISHGNYLAKRYKYIAHIGVEYNQSVMLYTQEDISPMPLLFLPQESAIINMMENGEAYYIVPVIRGDEINMHKLKETLSSSHNRYFPNDPHFLFLDVDSTTISARKLLTNPAYTAKRFDGLRKAEGY